MRAMTVSSQPASAALGHGSEDLPAAFQNPSPFGRQDWRLGAAIQPDGADLGGHFDKPTRN